MINLFTTAATTATTTATTATSTTAAAATTTTTTTTTQHLDYDQYFIIPKVPNTYKLLVEHRSSSLLYPNTFVVQFWPLRLQKACHLISTVSTLLSSKTYVTWLCSS